MRDRVALVAGNFIGHFKVKVIPSSWDIRTFSSFAQTL